MCRVYTVLLFLVLITWRFLGDSVSREMLIVCIHRQKNIMPTYMYAVITRQLQGDSCKVYTLPIVGACYIGTTDSKCFFGVNRIISCYCCGYEAETIIW